MRFRDLKDHIIKNAGLRAGARGLWVLSREIPRRIPLEKISYLQQWSGRPVGLHRVASDYLKQHPGKGWETVIHPAGAYHRVQPRETGVPLPPSFAPPQTVSWEPERVIFLENCRHWGAYGGSLVTHDERLLAELSRDVWGIKRHAIFNKLKLPDQQRLPGLTAVLSTPEADANYGHWLMDLLPRLELLAQAGLGPDKIDRYLLNRGNFPYEDETLALAGIPASKIMRTDALTHVRCEAIVTTSLRHAHWRQTLPAWVPGFLRRLIPPAETPCRPGARLYLSRRTAGFRRVLNEDALQPLLQEHGVETFDPGAHSVREQASAFAQAEVIIAPHGSALANLAFCRPGTTVAEIFPRDYFDVSFWTTASVMNAKYCAFVEKSPGSKNGAHIEFRRQDIVLSREFLNAFPRIFQI